MEDLSKPELGVQSSLDYFSEQLREQHKIHIDGALARSFLGSFGLRGQVVLMPLSLLSGGQKVN